MNGFKKTVLATTAAMVLGFGANAHALLVLTIDDLSTVGVDAIIVDDVDGGVGTFTTKGFSTSADGSPGDGLVTFNGAVGSFIVNVTTGISKPVIGNPSKGRIDLNSVNVSGSAGTLQLMLTDVDFSLLGQNAFPHCSPH